MKTNNTTSNALKARALAKAKEATFVRGGYKVTIECSLEEYSKEFDKRYRNISSAEVIAVETKDGNEFLKVLFHSSKGDDLEMKLSKKSSLEEEDSVDINTLKFLFIEKGEKCDWVVDGDPVEE